MDCLLLNNRRTGDRSFKNFDERVRSLFQPPLMLEGRLLLNRYFHINNQPLTSAVEL